MEMDKELLQGILLKVLVGIGVEGKSDIFQATSSTIRLGSYHRDLKEVSKVNNYTIGEDGIRQGGGRNESKTMRDGAIRNIGIWDYISSKGMDRFGWSDFI